MEAGKPVIVEYAVASEYLDSNYAEKTRRFSYKDPKNPDGKPVPTFDTKKARKIYNKLALRNVLAGRLPLFNYNTTFETNFSEVPYAETSTVQDTSVRNCLIRLGRNSTYNEYLTPTESNPYRILVDGNTTLSIFQQDGAYIGTQSTVRDIIKDTINGPGNEITGIKPFCNLNDLSGAQNLPLIEGEKIKFRAPNFITVKTYPAYVNYRLELKSSADSGPKAAKAYTLLELLDSDLADWTPAARKVNTRIRWEKTLEYFKALDLDSSKTDIKYVQKFTLKQKISKFTKAEVADYEDCPANPTPAGKHELNPSTSRCKYCNEAMFNSIQEGPIVLNINNGTGGSEEKDLETLLAKCGRIKLTNECTGEAGEGYTFKARLCWDPEEGEICPASEGPSLEILVTLKSPFISDLNTINELKAAATQAVEERRSATTRDGSSVLPASCSWAINFDFECVPFEAVSLKAWHTFVKTANIFDFRPIEDSGALFRRAFGEGYAIGKNVLADHKKLLPFDAAYFGKLSVSNYLSGIYLVKSPGDDGKARVLANAEEYRLQEDEYLYIEYTPSSTTAEGAVQELEPVTELLGEGTIIRPSGFEGEGLVNSETFEAQGNSAYKKVRFTVEGTQKDILMYRFGANEQVEVREKAEVTLSKDTFKTSPMVYIFKNFDCPDLEAKTLNASGEAAINPTYTLKDGEYIFYTDQNKTELAYFGSGTEVTLGGNIVLPKFANIDMNELLEASVEKIPWKYLSLGNNDQAITFTEYQYVTLGKGDVLNTISLLDGYNSLDETWRKCNEVSYTSAEKGRTESLPKISISDNSTEPGNGWEACSVLELNVAPDEAQTLRRNDRITTGLQLLATDDNGRALTDKVIPESDSTLSFKTNLPCLGLTSNKIEGITLNDAKQAALSTSSESGFKFKLFVNEPPVFVETLPGTVAPTEPKKLTDWLGEPIPSKDYLDTWNQIDLDRIKVSNGDVENPFDQALRFSVSTIPGTYAVMCIYLKYSSTEAHQKNAETWIEVARGITNKDIQIFNPSKNSENSWQAATTDSDVSKLFLQEGINCIRINKKVCQLFIKTSAVSQGILMFDDYKLVNKQSITHKNSAGGETVLDTYGLNLDQIGYLNTATAKDGLGETAKEQLKQVMYQKFLETLPSLSETYKKDFLDASNCFVSGYENIKGFKTDLDNISKTSNNKVWTLIDKHRRLTTTISTEHELLDLLAEKSLEEELLTLIKQYSTSETMRAQILEELDTLRATTITTLNNRTVEQSWSSIKACANNSASYTAYHDELAKILSSAKSLIKYELNRDTLTQLNTLLIDLEQAASDEEKQRVKAAAEKLENATTSNDVSFIQFLLNQILARIDMADVNNLLSELIAMIETGAEGAFGSILVKVSELKHLIITKNVQFYIDELNKAIVNKNKHAKQILVELTNEIVSTGATTAFFNLLVAVEALATKVLGSTKITLFNNKGAVLALISTVVQSVSTFCGLAVPVFTRLGNELNKLFVQKLLPTDIPGLPNIIDDKGYSKAVKALENLIDELQANTNQSVQLLVEQATDAISKYRAASSEIESIELVMLKDSHSSHIESSKYFTSIGNTMANLWLPISSQLLLTEFNNNFFRVRSNINITDLRTLKTAKKDIKDNKTDCSFTGMDAQLLAFNKLLALMDALILSVKAQTKDNAIILIIKELESVVGLASTLNTTKSALTTADDKVNGVLIHLLDELTTLIAGSTTSVSPADEVEKATKASLILQDIKVELENVIAVNSHLVGIIENQVCPRVISVINSYNKLVQDKLTEQLANNPSVIPTTQTITEEIAANNYEFALALRLHTALFVKSGNDGIKIKESASALSKDFTVLIQNIENMIKFNLNNIQFISQGNWQYSVTIDYSENLSGVEHVSQTSDEKALEILTTLITILLEIDKCSNKLAELTELSDITKAIGELLDENSPDSAESDVVKALVANLNTSFTDLDDTGSSNFIEETGVLFIEQQLLADLLELDKDREFYYTMTIDPRLALDFIGNTTQEKSLMNPASNYNVNNVNNSFVVSKLDIDFLGEGISIARASRIS
jgi:hypothetical protein